MKRYLVPSGIAKVAIGDQLLKLGVLQVLREK